MIIILATMNGNEKKNLYFDDFSSYNNLYTTCIIINNIILGKWYTHQGDKNNNNGN